MGLTGIGMGSVVVVTDLLFLLGEVGRGESSIPGERALEEWEEALSGVERRGWVVEAGRGRAEGGKALEGEPGTRGPGEGGEEGERGTSKEVVRS